MQAEDITCGALARNFIFFRTVAHVYWCADSRLYICDADKPHLPWYAPARFWDYYPIEKIPPTPHPGMPTAAPMTAIQIHISEDICNDTDMVKWRCFLDLWRCQSRSPEKCHYYSAKSASRSRQSFPSTTLPFRSRPGSTHARPSTSSALGDCPPSASHRSSQL